MNYRVTSLLPFALLLPMFAQAENSAQLTDIEIVGDKPIIEASQIWTGNVDKVDASTLRAVRAVSLGQTLEKQSGVHNQNMGPNNGLPQIRSLSGNRVRLLQNGLDVSDMSAISGNLAVPLDVSLAEEIDVYKSSASVLYGGNAVGGAVDVRTRFIPSQLPDKAIGGTVDISKGFNAPNSGQFSLDGKINERVAWHVDGGIRKISRYRIPGNAKADICYDKFSVGLRYELTWLCQTQRDFHDWIVNKAYFAYVNHLPNGESIYSKRRGRGFVPNKDYVPGTQLPYLPNIDKAIIVDVVPQKVGEIPNSHFESKNASAGISYVGEHASVGIGVSRYLTGYGVPGFASRDTWTGNSADGLLPANVRAEQTRWEIQGEYRPQVVWADSIRLRLADTRADNQEYLGDVFAGSLNARTQQARTEFYHNIPAAVYIDGVVGADWRYRRTDGGGADRYIGDTSSRDYAFFIAEKAQWRGLTAGFGYRVGKAQRNLHATEGYKPSRGRNMVIEKPQREFTLHDYQLSFKWQPSDIWFAQVQYNYGERAPDINELFSNNRHFAIFTNEHGNSTLNKERMNNWEFSSGLKWHDLGLTITHYRTDFRDYLYLAATGTERYNMPYKEWRQGDTAIRGFETELNYSFDSEQWGQWQGRLFADWVKNMPIRNDDNGYRVRNEGDYMPGLPTNRYGVGLNWQKDGWRVSTSLTRFTEAKHLGKILNTETPLGSYNTLDAYVSYSLDKNDIKWEWYLDGRNLTNASARAYNSPLKYLSPLPGRSLSTGVKIHF
ncbi:TonB-dependent receptor [Suttonella sp. R2A3]|uniref:TonB-dependent receptor n=1 Tax=Suttonella sp. R2A3 TaxID=2908648 RepID=UPI001F32B947|nr:TonB-dependent receptor [Suttonella sp. R2A3]UJF24810.1 TonB-dependent receptor [Suttonella sp. R2A3]